MKKKQLKYVSLIAIAAISTSLLSFTNSATSVSKTNGYTVKSEIKDFKLENVDGKKVSLASYKDAKGYIIVFTCNHCPYSKAYETRILELDKKYASKGFPVIAISSNDQTAYPEDSFENMKKIAKEKSYTFPYLFDETQEVAKAFGAQKTPHVYVVNKKDKSMIVEYIGAIDNSPRDESNASKLYVEDAVNALLSGKSVPTTETKAIGCGIKWKS